MIQKISSSVDYDYWLKRLDTQLTEWINQNSLEAPKVVNPTNEKTLLKTLGTSVINRLLSPSFFHNKINKYKFSFDGEGAVI